VAKGGARRMLDAAYRLGHHAQSLREREFWRVASGRPDAGELLRGRPLEACSWGVWRPTTAFQRLVQPFVRDALPHTMLVCKRLGVPHGVAVIVCSYLCTEGEEWTKDAPKAQEEDRERCAVQ